MSESPPAPGHPAIEELAWLVSNFVAEVSGVQHALVVSSDGVVLTASRDLPTPEADQLAAITSGMYSLAASTAVMFAKGGPEQLLLRMGQGHLVVTEISGGSSLAVLTTREADMKIVSYQMTHLVESAGHALTPRMREAPAEVW